MQKEIEFDMLVTSIGRHVNSDNTDYSIMRAGWEANNGKGKLIETNISI